jgi:hypothetical protein
MRMSVMDRIEEMDNAGKLRSSKVIEEQIAKYGWATAKQLFMAVNTLARYLDDFSYEERADMLRLFVAMNEDARDVEKGE